MSPSRKDAKKVVSDLLRRKEKYSQYDPAAYIFAQLVVKYGILNLADLEYCVAAWESEKTKISKVWVIKAEEVLLKQIRPESFRAPYKKRIDALSAELVQDISDADLIPIYDLCKSLGLESHADKVCGEGALRNEGWFLKLNERARKQYHPKASREQAEFILRQCRIPARADLKHGHFSLFVPAITEVKKHLKSTYKDRSEEFIQLMVAKYLFNLCPESGMWRKWVSDRAASYAVHKHPESIFKQIGYLSEFYDHENYKDFGLDALQNFVAHSGDLTKILKSSK